MKAGKTVSRIHGPLRQAGLLPISPATAGFWRRIAGHRGHPGDAMGPIPWQALQRIVIMRFDGIGDMVLTTPFLRAVRENAPHAAIRLVTLPTVVNLVETSPFVDERFSIALPSGGGVCVYVRFVRLLAFARQHFRHWRPDLALLPRYDTDAYQTAWLSVLSGAIRRAGFSERCTALKRYWNRGYDRFLTHAVPGTPAEHEVLRNLALIAALGGTARDRSLAVSLTPSDQTAAEQALQPFSGSRKPLAVIAPGAAHPVRQWPVGQYAELCRRLVRSTRLAVVGSAKDRDAGERLREATGRDLVNLAGPLTLRQTLALMKRAAVFVGSDSGPMHLAAAAGIPVVAISVRRDMLRRFAPWQVPFAAVYPQSSLPPCPAGDCVARSAHCIRTITPDAVAEAVERVMRERTCCP